ncbi:MAG: TIGR00304 family protein [Aigarchaeota archaeon]|nr:TIGR00304 family protein [Aigarchaeota archaeon]MDW8092966.1 TIGR00304 family protein [Nitrososphaerota archaeon]
MSSSESSLARSSFSTLLIIVGVSLVVIGAVLIMVQGLDDFDVIGLILIGPLPIILSYDGASLWIPLLLLVAIAVTVFVVLARIRR